MWPFKRKEPCLHDWQVLDKTEFPSAVEVLRGMNMKFNEPVLACFTRKVVMTIACKKCGELHIEKNEGPC